MLIKWFLLTFDWQVVVFLVNEEPGLTISVTQYEMWQGKVLVTQAAWITKIEFFIKTLLIRTLDVKLCLRLKQILITTSNL